MAEQAQRGELVFRSKLASPDPPSRAREPRVAVRRLARRAAGWPLRCSRFASSASLPLLLLVWLIDRWLTRSGLPAPAAAAGAAPCRNRWGPRGVCSSSTRRHCQEPGPWTCAPGAFPFLEVIANPHFVAGTALLLGGLSAFAARRPWLGVCNRRRLSAWCDPYDAALLGRGRRRRERCSRRTARGVASQAAARRGLRSRRRWPTHIWLFTRGPGVPVSSRAAYYASVAPSPRDLSAGPLDRRSCWRYTACAAFRRGRRRRNVRTSSGSPCGACARHR